jgi:phosphatidylserine/phosphatidylglycerophosphate/cardiolipin synthase-like enzyme
MRERAAKGVDVAGIFEKVGSDTQYSEMIPFWCANIPVRQDGNPSFMHHKVIIVDAETVITGSLNFSDSADTSNDENVVVLQNERIAAKYLEEFNRLWKDAAPPSLDANVCP